MLIEFIFQGILFILISAVFIICVIGMRRERKRLEKHLVFLEELNKIHDDFLKDLKNLQEMSEKENDKIR